MESCDSPETGLIQSAYVQNVRARKNICVMSAAAAATIFLATQSKLDNRYNKTSILISIVVRDDA